MNTPRILLCHNYYAQSGGEDTVVGAQLASFQEIAVLPYTRNSTDISGYGRRKKLGLLFDAYGSRSLASDIQRIRKDFRPDIAHVHNVFPLLSPRLYKVLKDNGIPIVQTIHNFRFICPNGLMYQKGKVCEKCLEKRSSYYCGLNRCYRGSLLQSFWYSDIIRRAQKRNWFGLIDRYITLNPFYKQKLAEAGFDERKIVVIPNFTREPQIDRNLAKEDYMLYIGRLSQEKGLFTLLEAMEQLGGSCIRLKIAGAGPLREALLKHMESRKLSHVQLIGQVGGVAKEELMQKAKAVIVPSEWYENLPTVILESFSVGTPVIVSDIGGLSCLVREGVNGLKFEAGSSMKLAEAVMALQHDASLLEAMSQKARETYESEYTLEVYKKRMMALYQDILSDQT